MNSGVEWITVTKSVIRKGEDPAEENVAHLDQTEQKEWCKFDRPRPLNSHSVLSLGICLDPYMFRQQAQRPHKEIMRSEFKRNFFK